jgi:hypothetical protein
LLTGRGNGLALRLTAAAIALAPASPVSAQPVRLDRAFLVGRWTDNGDCADATTFNRDASFLASNGGAGLWHLQDGRLTMTGTRTLRLGVTAVDRNTVTVVNEDGSPGRSTRCPGGERGANLPLDGTRLDRRYLIGRWTDNDNCADAVAFNAGGGFHAPNNTAGIWALRGDRVTLTGSSTLVLQIVPVSRDRILVVNPDGSLGKSTRC